MTALTNALLAAAQMRDMATNTGGVKWRPPAKKTEKRRLLSTEQIVERMRVSYPALRAAKVDPALKQLFLAELLTQAHNERSTVVVPEGTALKMVSSETFSKYKEALSGLNEENVANVTTKLIQLGLAGGEATQRWQPGQAGSYHPSAMGPPPQSGSYHPGGMGPQQLAGSYQPGGQGPQQGGSFLPGGSGVPGVSQTLSGT